MRRLQDRVMPRLRQRPQRGQDNGEPHPSPAPTVSTLSGQREGELLSDPQGRDRQVLLRDLQQSDMSAVHVPGPQGPPDRRDQERETELQPRHVQVGDDQ